MSTLTLITRKELEQEIKNKENSFVGRKTFYSGDQKMGNAKGHQGENEWQQKKSKREHIQHQSSIKHLTRKFLKVSCFSSTKKQQ